MTLREYRVGVDRNPRSSPEVDELKRKGADLTDAIQHRAVEAEAEVLDNSGVALFEALARTGVKFATA